MLMPMPMPMLLLLPWLHIESSSTVDPQKRCGEEAAAHIGRVFRLTQQLLLIFGWFIAVSFLHNKSLWSIKYNTEVLLGAAKTAHTPRRMKVKVQQMFKLTEMLQSVWCAANSGDCCFHCYTNCGWDLYYCNVYSCMTIYIYSLVYVCVYVCARLGSRFSLRFSWLLQWAITIWQLCNWNLLSR